MFSIDLWLFFNISLQKKERKKRRFRSCNPTIQAETIYVIAQSRFITLAASPVKSNSSSSSVLTFTLLACNFSTTIGRRKKNSVNNRPSIVRERGCKTMCSLRQNATRAQSSRVVDAFIAVLVSDLWWGGLAYQALSWGGACVWKGVWSRSKVQVWEEDSKKTSCGRNFTL